MRIEPDLWQLYLDVYFRPIRPLRFEASGAIISLWNPRGETQSTTKNERLSRFWQGALQRANRPYQLLWGGDKPMLYRELSVFIRCDLALAFRWASRLDQLGFYYVQQDKQLRLYNSWDITQTELVTGEMQTRLCFTPLPRTNLALQ